MQISNELLFFFSALGAFNGLLLGLYFALLKRPKHLSNFFLGGFLICMSIRIGKSVIFYFNEDFPFGYLQFGLTACFFIGPFLYFYFSSLFVEKKKLLKRWKWHLIVLVPLILAVNVFVPFEHHIDLWRPYIIEGIYAVWICYSLAALPYLIRQVKQDRREQRSLSALSIWSLSIYIGNILIWAAFEFCGFTSYILGALLFSFMFYLLLLLFMFRKRSDFSASQRQEKYKDKKISDHRADTLMAQLEQYMAESQIYTDPNVKLADIAKTLNVLPHTLSQLLNDNYGKSFPQFINEHRITAAKEMMVNRSELTLAAIAYDSGFNSKSAFYSSFKKLNGMTPSAFQKQQNKGA